MPASPEPLRAPWPLAWRRDRADGAALALPADAGRGAASRGEAQAPREILILCGDADHNLGDRAILQAMCQELGRLGPEARITVVSRDPSRAQHDYGACAIAPGPTGLPALCRAAWRSDLVLCGGGGLFQDDDSLIKMPYWAARAAFARLMAGRVVGYALGVGPLRNPLSRLFARLAFACMERVSVHDPEALQVAQPLTYKRVELLPDPALLLEAAPADAARAVFARHGVPVDGRPLVGVAVRRWFPPQNRILPHRLAARLGRPDPQAGPQGRDLIVLLAQTLDEILRRHDAHVLFLPTYTVPHEGDDRLCEQIIAQMRRPGAHLLRLDDARVYKAVCRELAVMLGGRMHPTILAAATGTPVVGLAYNQKFNGFFALIGAQDRVLDVQAFVRARRTDQLAAMVDDALRAPPAASERIGSLAHAIVDFNRSLVAS